MALIKNNYYKFLLYFVILVFINYYTPHIVRVFAFLSLLIVFYYSKDNPFWIAFFWLILNAPAYLFYASDPIHNLFLWGVPGSDRSISFFELVIVVAFIKAYFSNTNFRINRIFLLVIAYSIFLLLLSFAIGISPMKVLRTIRFFAPYTLLWSVPAILLTKEKFLELFNYFLKFSIVIVALQLYMFLKGQHFSILLGGQFSGTNEILNTAILESEQDLMRPLYSTQILFLNVIVSLYYLITNSKQKPKYTEIYLLLSFIGLIVTGTRGYSIGIIVMIIIYFIASRNKIKSNFKLITLSIIGLVVLLSISSFRDQLDMAVERIMTVEQFAEGDITAGGTVQRFDKYMPMVMDKFAESPIFGWGFSNEFFANTNAHVAIPNILLNGGILGLLVFIYFLFYLYRNSLRRNSYHNDSGKLIIAIGLTGYLILHSFSFAVFSFLLGQANYSCFVLFLCFSDILIRNSNEYGIKENLQKI